MQVIIRDKNRSIKSVYQVGLDMTFAVQFLMTFLLVALSFTALMPEANAQWKVDFSRRSKNVREEDLRAAGEGRAPASLSEPSSGRFKSGDVVTGEPVDSSGGKGMFDVLFESGEPIQEIVILNTDRGFVPAQVRVRKNGRYKIHVVNVNEKEKNISFILDGFSEHHATYYGKIKTFMLEPKKEGIYSFQSPETAVEGRLVVFNPQASVRAPAGEDNK